MAQGNLFIVVFPKRQSILDSKYTLGTYTTFTADSIEAVSRFLEAKVGIQQYNRIYEIGDYEAALTERQFNGNRAVLDQEFTSIEEIKELVKEITTKEVTVETEIEVVNC